MSATVANACPRHPGVAAQFTCSRCNTPCCLNCCYSMPDGSICCATCYHQPSNPAPAPLPTASVSSPLTMPTGLAPAGAAAGNCPQHPLLPPVAHCKICGRGSCVTCDFFFPPNIHLCPVCVTTAHTKLTPLRKKYLVTALVMAGWSTIGIVVLISGALAGVANDRISTVLVGFGVIVFIAVPCTIGTGVAWAALKPGGPNPIGIWIALAWNVLLLGTQVLLTIVGNLMKS